MEKRPSPLSPVPRGKPRARSGEAGGPPFPWLRVGAWGLAVLLLLFFLTPVFATSAFDLALWLIGFGLVAGMAGLLAQREKYHARRVREERRTVDRLLAASEALSTPDLATLMQRLAEEAAQFIPCRGACALLLDRRQERIEHLVTAGQFPLPQAGDLLLLLPKEIRRAVREQGAVVLRDPQALRAQLRSPRVQDFAQHNLLIVGIRPREQSGFLILADDRRGEN